MRVCVRINSYLASTKRFLKIAMAVNVLMEVRIGLIPSGAQNYTTTN